ncbi:MAG TPA: amidohydrolase family protein [Ilumatobacteraceae bacterium]|nr:amidohydrolase family protein [Ilumatobacteraceae bacterium]
MPTPSASSSPAAPLIDGWLNVFRLTADDPIQAPDAHTAATNELFGGDAASSWLATTLADGITAMDASGVARALIGVTTRAAGAPQPGQGVDFGPVEFGLEACRREPDRVRLVLQVHDVTLPHAAAAQVRRHGALDEVVAVGVFPAALGCDITDRRLYPLYSACVDLGLPVRINLGIAGPHLASKHQHPAMLEELLIDFPELVVIGCHMGHPYERLIVRLIMKFPNLFLMTSGYLPKYFDPELVRFMGSSRGSGRIVFGSDHPGIPLSRALDEARRLAIGDSARDEFLGAALARLIRWS